MLPRITGTETEYSVSLQKAGQQPSRAFDTEILEILRELPKDIPRIGEYLSNGARLYRDVGGHAEYATAEDTSFEGTTANELAAEDTIINLVRTYCAGKGSDFSINKRVIDMSDESGLELTRGYHENYLCPRELLDISASRLALLGMHLATRGVYTGAGCVRKGRVGSRQAGSYAISQKVLGIYRDSGLGTTLKSKALVNLRDEPLADLTKWTRVHVTSGDVNISPWATRMKLGTTSIVLRLLENGYVLRDLNLHYREGALAQLALHAAIDTTLQKPFHLRTDRKIRPLNVQYELLAAARELSAYEDFPNEEKEILDEWERALTILEENPSRLLEADWVARQRLIDKRLAKYEVGLDSEEARIADLQYDLLDNRNGIGMQLRKRAWQEWMPDEELVIDRRANPPKDTRAFTRGEFIRRFHDTAHANVLWHKLKFPDGHEVSLGNPYDSDIAA